MFAGRSRSSKRFPNLADYLRKVVDRRLGRVQRLSTLLGCGIVSLTTPIFALAFGLGFQSVGAGLLAATLAMPASVFAWYLVDKKLRTPHSPEEERRMEAWKACSSMLGVEQQRRLHKLMDPSMSQLLEACAYHYARIDGAVSGEFWNNEKLPAHWRSVRSQALEAADQAMEELVMLAVPCMGEPEADRGKVIKEAVEDFFDMDIVSAIGSIRDAATSDWTRYAHRSPHATVAFQAGRAIAERLKTLADQIEAKTSEVAVESGAVMEAANATDSLDIVLREITAVKEAEEELQQRIKETE